MDLSFLILCEGIQMMMHDDLDITFVIIESNLRKLTE